MAVFDDIDGILPGLLPAAWRGIRFWTINAQHSVGRRIHQVLYPGLDLKTHDDTGPLDGPIRMSGLVIGDDYIAQANALEAAFRKAGPATLIHPWRGPIRCVLFRPAQFEYDVKELRVVRIDAEFDPVTSAGLASLGTSLSQALSGLVGLRGSASGLAQAAIAASPMAYALYGRAIAATAGTIDVAGFWASRSPRSAALLPPIAAARISFSAATAQPLRADAAPLLAAVPSALASALAEPFKPQPASGIGPGTEAVAVAAADPRAGATLMLTIAADLGRRLRPGEAATVSGLDTLTAVALPTSLPEKAVIAAAEVAVLVEAARLITSIGFASRQEAEGWGGRLSEALRRSAVSAAALANESVAPAAALWRALHVSRGQFAVDLSDTLGRLPSVRRIEAPGRASAMLLAQHLAGDVPADVFGFAQDIVTRNGLRHPAQLGGDGVEVLL